MPKKGKTPRPYAMMYEQQVKYSPYKTVQELYDAVKNKVNPKEFAVILHDKDVDDAGNIKEPHLHSMMRFQNGRSINSIAKLLGDKPQYIESWNNKVNNGFAYLVHRTESAKSKYQYDPSSVIANFDYPAKLETIAKQVLKADSKEKTDTLLDDLYDGTLKREEVEERMTGSQYGKNCRKIEDISAKRLQQEALEFNRKRIASGQPLTVVWIYGVTGTGKTSFAKDIVKKKNRPYFISGSTRDIFQKYNAEHSIILDEFRPNLIAYPDLLRILDPFAEEVMAPARYHDKYLATDIIIITSPYSPIEYYQKVFPPKKNEDKQEKENVDTFGQLKRRISITFCMDYDYIYLAEYDGDSEYFTDDNYKTNNPYSTIARTTTLPDAKDLFEELTK